jgi:hypothetical protein
MYVWYRTLKGPAKNMRRSATICVGDEIDLVASSNNALSISAAH